MSNVSDAEKQAAVDMARGWWADSEEFYGREGRVDQATFMAYYDQALEVVTNTYFTTN